MHTSRILVPVVALMLLLAASPGGADGPGPPVGEWKYSGGKKEVAVMEKAVDEIVDEMNVFIRPIARARLPKICSPWKKLAIEKKGNSVVIRNERRNFVLPIGKTVQREGPDGSLKVTLKHKDGVLHETLVSDDGTRVNEFHAIPGGVRVETALHSKRLPRPMRFSYSYR
jgi:hypothetical protein